MYDLVAGMNSGIGSTGTLDNNGGIGDGAEGLFEGLLYRGYLRLALTLPAMKGTAVIANGHGYTITLAKLGVKSRFVHRAN